MGCRKVLAIFVSVTAVAGCGGSPSSPSPGSAASTQSAESAVMSAMSQAVRQIALTPPSSGGAPNTFTMPCEGGGSIVMTLGQAAPPEGNLFRTSSRIEFRDCRTQTVTINGDPYLETSGEHSFPTPGPTGSDSISTMRTTGGMRFDNSGVQGRVQFNCTTTITIHLVNGSQPEVSVVATGTTTFEQPLGSTPTVRPCGPS